MATKHLGRSRLVAQGVATRAFATPTEAVRAHGAMQGQDLPGVLSSAALRTPGGVDAVIEALDAGELVRGYPMRGTVFLMTAEDAAWMTDLMAASQLKAAERRRPQIGLTNDHLDEARAIAQTVLDVDGGLPRADLFAHWESAGIPTGSGPGYHLLSALIHEGMAVYGPWNGSDQNVMLAERWLPAGTRLAERFNGDRIAAVAELAGRYFTSHGPASERDFAWWTKLPLKEIRAALPLVDGLETDGESYWRAGLVDEIEAAGPAADALYLLPGFDEFILGYQDRLFAMTDEQHKLLVPGNNGVFKRAIVHRGRVIGTWKRAGTPGRRKLALEPFKPLTKAQTSAAEKAYAAFPFPTE